MTIFQKIYVALLPFNCVNKRIINKSKKHISNTDWEPTTIELFFFKKGNKSVILNF